MTDATSALPEVADLGLHRVPVPEGARCDQHGQDAATFVCTLCKGVRCERCLWGRRAAREICRDCAKEGLPEPIAWERRDQLGVMTAFGRSVVELLVSPVRFFRSPALEDDAVGGFEHGLASFAVGQLAVFLQGLITFALFGTVIAAAAHVPQLAAFFGGYSCFMFAMIPAVLAHVPMTTLLAVGTSAACMHLTLKLFGAARAPFFAGTVRATSYAFASHVMLVVPVVGPLIALVWTILLETIGIREVHRCGTFVALVAVLAYRFLLLAVFLGLYAALFAVALAAPH